MTTPFEHDSRDLAQTYDRVSDLQFEGGKRLVERLGLNEGARVLDVGCGTGRLAHWIAGRVGTRGAVTGMCTADGLRVDTVAAAKQLAPRPHTGFT